MHLSFNQRNEQTQFLSNFHIFPKFSNFSDFFKFLNFQKISPIFSRSPFGLTRSGLIYHQKAHWVEGYVCIIIVKYFVLIQRSTHIFTIHMTNFDGFNFKKISFIQTIKIMLNASKMSSKYCKFQNNDNALFFGK